MFRDNPGLELIFGPGGRSHPNLNPDRRRDVREYVEGPGPVDGVYYTRLSINHWGGTCPLRTGPGGVHPETLRVKGTRNIHVVDASLHPAPLSAHPVATIMAVAERASHILSRQLARAPDSRGATGYGQGTLVVSVTTKSLFSTLRTRPPAVPRSGCSGRSRSRYVGRAGPRCREPADG